MSTIDAITRNGDATSISEADLESLASTMRGDLVLAGDDEYDVQRRVWNGMIDKHPAVIARCAGTADVVAAVNFARANDLRVAVRGGGHNAAGAAMCDGGLVVDLTPMKGVHVDPVSATVRAQGGVTIGDLDRETQVFDLAVPLGVVTETGIAGLTLGGGLGWLRRKYGLSCDNMISAEVVTADGRVVTASESENSELLWGLRGGGGNFGVVTSFEFNAYPLGPDVYFAAVFHRADDAEAVKFYREWSLTAPDEISAIGVMWHAPEIDEIAPEHHGAPIIAYLAMHSGTPEEGGAALRELREYGSPIADLSGTMPYLEVQQFFDEDYPKWVMRYYWTSSYVHDMPDELVDRIVELNSQAPSHESTIDLWQMGGAASRIPADATSLGDRSAKFMLGVEANWEDSGDDSANVEWARSVIEAAKPWATGGRYANFPGMYEDAEETVRGSFGGNYDRLVALKQQYDPTNLFQLNHNIAPSTETAAAAG